MPADVTHQTSWLVILTGECQISPGRVPMGALKRASDLQACPGVLSMVTRDVCTPVYCQLSVSDLQDCRTALQICVFKESLLAWISWTSKVAVTPQAPIPIPFQCTGPTARDTMDLVT